MPLAPLTRDRILRVGGYIEQVELSRFVRSFNGTFPVGSALAQLTALLGQISITVGRGFLSGEQIEHSMKNAGFVDIVRKQCQVPIGPWAKGDFGKTCGLFYREYILQALEGFVLRGLTSYLGVSTTAATLTNLRLITDGSGDTRKLKCFWQLCVMSYTIRRLTHTAICESWIRRNHTKYLTDLIRNIVYGKKPENL